MPRDTDRHKGSVWLVSARAWISVRQATRVRVCEECRVHNVRRMSITSSRHRNQRIARGKNVFMVPPGGHYTTQCILGVVASENVSCPKERRCHVVP